MKQPVDSSNTFSTSTHGHRRPVTGSAWILIATCGLASTLAMTALARQSDPSQSPATAPTPAPPPAPTADPTTDPSPRTPPPNHKNIERMRQLQREAAARQAAAAGQAPPPVPANPNGASPAGAANANPIEPALDPGAAKLNPKPGEPCTVSLNFPEPVDLMAFVEWASKTLSINFITDESLQGRRVVFKAPMKIECNELLKLLGRLVEEQDFVLSKDPLGFYTIKPNAKVPVIFAGQGVELPTTRVIQTPMVRPSSMQAAITAALGGQAGGGGQGPRITPIDDIGVLIVTASPGTIATVEKFIETITAELTNQKLRRFQLNHVAADFALNRILTLNGKMAQAGQPGLQPQQPIQGGAGGFAGALTNLDARLFIDPGNAIIFRGPEAEANQVKELIDMIDVVTQLTAKRYATGSVTQEVASAGERIGLGPITQASSGSFGGGGFQQPAFRQPGQQNNQQSDLPGSGFTVDTERGSIIYYGTESQHEVVAQLVKTFTDQAMNDDDVIRMYKLVYSKAESVAEVLNSLLQNGANRSATSPFLPRNTSKGASSPLVTPKPPEPATPATGSSGDEGTTISGTSENTVVVPDKERNQILIKAPGPLQRQFAKLIAQLDQRQPQVDIEARIVAVRIDDSFNYRADLRIDAYAFQFLSAFGITTPATASDAPGQTFPRIIPNPTGLTGGTAAVINQDHVQGIINALQTVGEAKIQSVPRILVNDNEEAKQSSTREIPFSSTSQTAGNPTITSQGGTAEAGTKLTVTPTISQGGDVILQYEIELSAFDTATAASSANGLQPPKQVESYASKVTIPSDATIVVGGFTLESKQKAVNKVPFLGDIPLIGLLFQSFTDQSQRTMIFVFITPRVLNDPTGADTRILTEGPLRASGVDPTVPELSPEAIPISATWTDPGEDMEMDPSSNMELELDPATMPEEPEKPVASAAHASKPAVPR